MAPLVLNDPWTPAYSQKGNVDSRLFRELKKDLHSYLIFLYS